MSQHESSKEATTASNNIDQEQASAKNVLVIANGSMAPSGQVEREKITEVELDEFGLPVKKFKALERDEDSEERDEAPDAINEEYSRDVKGNGKGGPKDVHESGKSKDVVMDSEVQESSAPSEKDTSAEGHPESPTRAEAQHLERQEARKSDPGHQRTISEQLVMPEHRDAPLPAAGASSWSHQQSVPQKTSQEEPAEGEAKKEDWQAMPALAKYDVWDDDGRLVARGTGESEDEEDEAYAGLGGAGKGYTKVNLDEDAQSASSMDDNTQYLFKTPGTNVAAEEDDEEIRDPLSQMQATKDLLTEGQRIAYVGLTRVAMVEMVKEIENIETTKGSKKALTSAGESLLMWSQKIMLRMCAHMDINPEEQLMIEQLSEHGVQPADLTPALMANARVKNPMNETEAQTSPGKKSEEKSTEKSEEAAEHSTDDYGWNPPSPSDIPPPPPYSEKQPDEVPEVKSPSQLPTSNKIDIDLRWTVLCDLFLVLVADSIYDARSRRLLERVGSFLDVSWVEISKFEKRVTDALEMQEAADKENWNEDEHMEKRRKMAIKRRMMMMGIATVGGGLVIGLSAGLLAPVIGAGLAAGFTTFGVAGTGSFLAGAGGAAIITTTGVVTGSTIGVRASSKRFGPVKTFEYRPLHNNKRVNLIVTVSGWMNGKVDDVRLPFSTVDPVMGDIYSVLWEPEMLQSTGQTINILASEALSQTLQQVLGSTILITLMASLQLPIVLTKLSYLIDNPWTVSCDRANSAGLILADSLIDRNLGVRPVTLVGFSLGARLIFSCLQELAKRGAVGIVQNVYLFGSPVVAKKDEYLKARSVIAGRFVNGYATNDWILGYLFRATSGGIMRVAGLAAVEGIPGLENHNVTELVNGHMAYRTAMPRLLREVGWQVDSDEFCEIEDPDPENHQERQREIIREIDEARKESEKEPQKRKFGIFGRNRKMAEKKNWEMYDDTTARAGQQKDGNTPPNGSVLFDVEAIKAELASEQIEVKQLESTLPPMRLDVISPPRSGTSSPQTDSRSTKSFDTQPVPRPKLASSSSSPVIGTGAANPTSPPLNRTSTDTGKSSDDLAAEPKISPLGSTFKPSPLAQEHRGTPQNLTDYQPRKDSASHNDVDDDEFGQEKEVTMSFE